MKKHEKCLGLKGSKNDLKISLFWLDFLRFLLRKSEFKVETIEIHKTSNKNNLFTINSEYAINILINNYVKIPTGLIFMFLFLKSRT